MKKSVGPYRLVSLENSFFSWTFGVVSQALPSLLHSRQLFHTFPSHPKSPVPRAVSTLRPWSYFWFYWEIARKETFPKLAPLLPFPLPKSQNDSFKSTPHLCPFFLWSQTPCVCWSHFLWPFEGYCFYSCPLSTVSRVSLPSANKHAVVSPTLKKPDIPAPFQAQCRFSLSLYSSVLRRAVSISTCLYFLPSQSFLNALLRCNWYECAVHV